MTDLVALAELAIADAKLLAYDGRRGALARIGRSRDLQGACTVEGEARPTSSPISRTVGG